MIPDGLLLFLPTLIIAYWVKRKVYLGPVDPLQLSAVSESVWVVTVYQLAVQESASPNQIAVFATCLILWWSMWWLFGERWGTSYRRTITIFWERIALMPRRHSIKITTLYLAVLLVVLFVTLLNGGGGDNRLAIVKLLRPIESVTTLLVPIVLFRLLIARDRRSKVSMALILTAMIVTGGKSSILALLVPVTGAALIQRVRIRVSTVAGLVFIGLLGFSASVAINYSVTDPLDVLTVLYTRLLLDGDVYLLSFPNDLPAQTSTTSLITYLLGPFIKLLFLPIQVDTSIGAQIAALINGEDTVNGPNPHWPIVLLAYHRSFIAAIWLSLICFAAMLWVKLRLTARSGRRWPLWLAVPLHAYVLIYPQTFFADPSFPIIYLVQALVLAGVLALVLRPVFKRRHRMLPLLLESFRPQESGSSLGHAKS